MWCSAGRPKVTPDLAWVLLPALIRRGHRGEQFIDRGPQTGHVSQLDDFVVSDHVGGLGEFADYVGVGRSQGVECTADDSAVFDDQSALDLPDLGRCERIHTAGLIASIQVPIRCAAGQRERSSWAVSYRRPSTRRPAAGSGTRCPLATELHSQPEAGARRRARPHAVACHYPLQMSTSAAVPQFLGML